MASERRTHLLRGLTVMMFVAVGAAVPGTAHADSIRDQQWHLDHLNIAEAQGTTRGEGVTVAVLDTGVDHRHPDLRGAVLKGHSYASGRADGRTDSDGHGTAMAGLIAGRGHGPDHGTGALGVAPEAKILPVRVGNGRSSDRAVEQGIEWAADHGADVISIAIGGPSEGYFQDAVDYALEQDVVVVASAGNTSDGSTEVEWPAAAQGVVAVSGTDRDDEFSDESVSGPETALAAPAEDIMSAGSGERGRYNTGTGTSDSTAIVSGVAALVRAKYPDLDAANVINRLIATADDKGPEGRDPEYGFGIVNPVKALTENVPEVSGNPLLPGASTAPTSVSPQAGEDSGPGPVGITLIFLGAAAVLAVLIAITIAAIRRRPHA